MAIPVRAAIPRDRALSDDEIRAMDSLFLPSSSAGHDHLVWREAHGCLVYDSTGRELVDFSSGVLVTNTGHSHPAVAEAIARQARTFLNAYDAPHPLRSLLAERLLTLAGRPPYTAVALLTTGSEAIDAALRVARAATHRYGVVSFSGGFHGRILTTIAIGGMPSVRRGMGPMAPGVVVAPFPNPYRPPVDVSDDALAEWCIAHARQLVATNLTEAPAAIIVEPYLGTGGGVVPPPNFISMLRSFADELGALFILDEVQSSFGRTGSWFAFQGLGVQPDIVVVAKGIASGVPMSALITRRELIDAMPAGSLWSTYGGNPISCAAALATIEVLEAPGLISRVAPLGDAMASRIRSWMIPGVGDVRNMGMSFGIELVSDPISKTPDPERAVEAIRAADRHGVVVLPPAGIHGNVVRLAPPLVISDEEVERGLLALRRALEETAPSI